MGDQTPMLTTVTDVRRLTPRMARITVASAELRRFAYDGPDQLVRIFLPNGRVDELTLPVTTNWWPELSSMPEATRPVVRNYTVRRLDRTQGELDIDFVLHGSGASAGPGSSFAEHVQPGDQLGVLSDGADYLPPVDTDWVLLVGDESALPAIAAILEQVPEGLPVVTLLEVEDAADEVELALPATWVHRGPGVRNLRVLAALRSLEFPAGTPYVWAAGESGLATGVRRHLVNDRGIAKDRIYFCGYWRCDAAEPAES
ncbi:siderophore-interacting protein [Kribbella sandramycini]|uniref:Siderophore-interacting protein n=1 Tax=Kribbella sandramycini TaxID=60450 RepID=A0A7Y4L7H9_9ACTN|nr:siderophore-interacting protein [Kribbella sandramycini]MBB6570246.1 YD repeat-containing protein [Kribbella sandramycini]NOL45835.1 siderophore-interacting protein [Kribbella sandramycini]